jgi:hypothetical protein
MVQVPLMTSVVSRIRGGLLTPPALDFTTIPPMPLWVLGIGHASFCRVYPPLPTFRNTPAAPGLKICEEGERQR